MKKSGCSIGRRLFAVLLCAVIASFGLLAPINAIAESEISITGVETNSKGETIVQWTGGGSECNMYYMYSSDPMSIWYKASENKSNNGRGTILSLAPGETYDIIVISGSSADTYQYRVPNVSGFDAYKISLRFSSLRYQNPKTGKYDMQKLPKKNARYISENINDIGFYVVSRYGTPQFHTDFNFTVLTVVTAPDGSLYSEYRDDVYMGKGTVWHEWAIMNLNGFFYNMIEHYGYVYPGRYDVKTYFDNKFLASDYFDVDSSDMNR